ncbi:MAG: AMP-binding protein [Desulfocucumaceae bacterium]
MERIWFKVWPGGVPKTLDYGESALPIYLEKQAQQQPEKAAIIYYGRIITYRELNDAACRFAAAMLNLGVSKGDRVGFYLDNCPQFIIAFFGALRCGAVLVAINPMFKRQELAYELDDAGVETLIVQDVLYPIFAALDSSPVRRVIVTSLWDYLPGKPQLPLHPDMVTKKQAYTGTYEFMDLLADRRPTGEFDPDTLSGLALLQYTSGTTGMPKGAMITHGNIVANCKGASAWAGYNNQDVHLTVMFHITGMILCMSAPLYSGGTIVLLTRFDVETVVKAIQLYRVSCWTL